MAATQPGRAGFRIRRQSTGKFQRVIPTLFHPPNWKILDAETAEEVTVFEQEVKAREAIADYTKGANYMDPNDFKIVPAE